MGRKKRDRPGFDPRMGREVWLWPDADDDVRTNAPTGQQSCEHKRADEAAGVERKPRQCLADCPAEPQTEQPFLVGLGLVHRLLGEAEPGERVRETAA